MNSKRYPSLWAQHAPAPNPSMHPSKTGPPSTPTNFEVQRISANHATNNGDGIVGYKLGNIAKVMQDAFGLDKPDYGFLLASTFVYEGITLWREQYIKPYVELEPAFVLRGHLRGPNVAVVDVINAIEVIDSTVKNWEIGLADTLADNGSTGSVILRGTPRRLTQLNLRDTWGSLRLNDKELMAGNTSNVLRNPLSAIAWLANRLAAYDIELTPGQVIMPGSCLQAVPMEQAGNWSCTFEGWGTIEFDVV